MVGIALITAAVFAASPQAQKREPTVLTIKSKGTPVAVLTLTVLDGTPLTLASGNVPATGKASVTFSGGVSVRLGQTDQAMFEIKADEVVMEMKNKR